MAIKYMVRIECEHRLDAHRRCRRSDKYVARGHLNGLEQLTEEAERYFKRRGWVDGRCHKHTAGDFVPLENGERVFWFVSDSSNSLTLRGTVDDATYRTHPFHGTTVGVRGDDGTSYALHEDDLRRGDRPPEED